MERYDQNEGAIITIDSERESLDISKEESSENGLNLIESEDYGSDLDDD